MNDWYSKILDEFHKERNTAAFYSTQGFKKLWNFAKDLTKKKDFQDMVHVLRKEYDIPEQGFIITTNSWTHPPENWKYYGGIEQEQIRIKIREFCKEQQLPVKDWRSIFEDYVFYNKLFLFQDPNSHNICYVTDIKTKRDSLGKEISDDIINAYPVALLISPYASERDILDFVKKLYKTEIEPTQKKHRKETALGKSRSKNLQKQARNEFIYEHRLLPLKQIASLVHKEFKELLDQGSIGKIISLEIKRRN